MKTLLDLALIWIFIRRSLSDVPSVREQKITTSQKKVALQRSSQTAVFLTYNTTSKNGKLSPKLLDLGAGPRSEKAVVEMVTKGYDSRIRPKKDSFNPVKVEMDSTLYNILEVVSVPDHSQIEAAELLVISQWNRYMWFDDYFTWDPEKFGGLDEVKLPLTGIWRPDIAIYGMIQLDQVVPDEQNFVKINSSGFVYCTFIENVKLSCNFDVTLFPFDTQNCTIHYGSWAYRNDEVDLWSTSPVGDISKYRENVAWTLLSFTNTRVFNSYASGNYSDLYYHLVFKRKSSYYMTTIVLPSFVIATLSFVGLFSPFNNAGERQEKVTLGLTTLLTLAVMLLIITQQMPKSSQGLPLLGLFIMLELMLSGMGTLLAVGLMYLHQRGNHGPPGKRLLRWLRLPEKEKVVLLSSRSPKSSNWLGRKSGDTPPTSPTRERNVSLMLSVKLKQDILDSAYLLRPDFQETQVKKLLKPCMDDIARMRDLLEGMKEDEEVQALWARLMSRIDLICLVSLLAINIFVTLLLFWIYPSYIAGVSID